MAFVLRDSSRAPRALAATMSLPLLVALLGSCTIHIPDPPRIDLSSVGLPRSTDGATILIEVQNSRLEFDPTVRDPITAVATCADLVTYCYAPGSRSLDDCIAAAAACRTNRPWEESTPCCPARCRDDYQRARRSGTEPMAAYNTVFLTAPTCFPGVDVSLAGGAP